ncbi:sortilin-related receptor-like [Papilio machaon]|uniref:sortilin-related receptor-like n=1 Tax=Papilio machaon TaxID=76193 RepID=UPI001E663DE1|nr:sortilin-related receptor-like [Papilio machaon]
MFTVIRRRISFVALLYFIPCVVSSHEYETWQKSLYVAQEPSEGSGKLFVINKFDTVGDGSHFERKKREAPTTPAPALEKNISTWTTHLNDSHQQLMVHWVGEGSKVIICLARDSSPRSNGTLSPSALFISYNYGQTIVNKTESFRLDDTPNSGYAQLDRFYNHPKHPEFCVFVDSINKRLYYTDDNGQNIHRSELTFHPSELLFDEDNPKRFVVLDKVGRNRMLYMTFNGGKTFTLIQSYVKTFFWSSGPGFPKMFYLERWEPNRSSTILSVSDPEDMSNAKVLFANAKEFQIKGDYMFAMRQKDNNTLDLYISHQRGPFYKAEFQTELDRRKFHIADVTDKRIFISVMHTENLTNLYVSEISNNFTQYNFVLSLEQVLCYFPQGNWKDSWLEDVTDDAFTDLYRVEGLKGIYIASKVNSKSLIADIEPEHLVSLITFDHGVTWSPIKPPAEDENGKPLSCIDTNDSEKSCSLHLCQKFSQLYPVTSPPGNVISNAMRSASIMSSKSAPGIIMATGVVGRSLKGIPGVYLSRDAGLTWKRILKDFYFFNYGDHGGVLVAVKYFKMLSETKEILYSTNEGMEWNSYQFNANDLRIYGLMTEPGENTTVFTMFGSANEQHQWIIITIDLQKAFPRNCTADDYKDWSPSPPDTTATCVLGTRDVFQRRLAHTNCYNGIDYDGPIRKEVCECGRRDFECDFGFVLSRNVCVHNKTSKYDPYSIPPSCRPGDYYERTKGYRKIDGDVCTTSGYLPYTPDVIPCPLDEPTEFLLVALRDKIARIDLSDNTTIFPIKDQQNIVAIEFDMKNNCIYWADIEVDKISRQCFETGFVQEVVVDTDLASIEGMALDWISNVLFFVDGMRKKIEAVRTDLSSEGRMRVTILGPDVLSKPRGIVVHPKAGYLFWTDWDRNNPSVSRSNLDGSHIVRLFEKPIVQWPNGITIDQMSERIYWVDAMEDYIASADLNGQYFKKILVNDEKVSHPFAVAVLKDKMYWDDWKAKSIFIADKDNGQNVITINGSFSGLMGLKVFAHFIQHGSNACSYKNTSCDALCLGGPGNSFSCLCPDGFVKSHGKCLCPNLVEPYANLTCPKKPGATCASDQFTCKNDMCIAQSWRCDGNDDCGDGSDEAGCLCAPPRVACDNGSCYLPQWRCDGDNDCSDMTDEKDCGKHNCSENEFQCGNGNCVDKRWVCDGDNDCKDDSDERNCTTQVKRPNTQVNCSVHSFACNDSSGMCIPNSWVCDNETDCPGGEDERDDRCRNSTCAPYMFRCPSGKCIYKSWVCDGENDCSDVESSDEKNCTHIGHSKLLPRPTTESPFSFPTNSSCLDWMIQCDNGNCLPYWWRCDGINDCGDNSDEVACGVHFVEPKPINRADSVRQKCGKTRFTCSPGVCIPLSWVCDSQEDCVDGSDEHGCRGRATAIPFPLPTCGALETTCRDGGCVLTTKICDGVPDCADHSDETHCTMKASKPSGACPGDQFECDEGTRCVWRGALCDGRQDCYDGSDETNCSSHEHNYHYVSLGVDQSSINSTSFLVSCWLAQQQRVVYSFLPSIANVSDGIWRNMTWTTDSVYRFTGLEPYTNYNVTFYIRDSKSNKTYPSMKYVNTTTGEGVPSPPLRVSVRQMIGSRVNVIWDPPAAPRGRLRRYTLYYAPPLPPAQKVVFVTHHEPVSLTVRGYFKPNTNYSFWVTATNNAYTSNSSEVMYLTFDEVGDVDDLKNITVTRLPNNSVSVKWDKIRSVDGYLVSIQLPLLYSRLQPIRTKENNVTLKNLPPGVKVFIHVMAYKGSMIGEPVTEVIITEGERDEMLNMTAILLKEKRTAVLLTWSPPLADRYKGKELQYQVIYTDAAHWRIPTDLKEDHEKKIITKNTSIVIDGLHACETYVFTVSLLGGPVAKYKEIVTRENPKAPIKDLDYEYNKEKSELKIKWHINCNALSEAVPYRLEITELTHNKVSRYALNATRNSSLEHVIENVPVGGRFNICVAAHVEGASKRCIDVRTGSLPAPRGLVAWLAPNGHLVLNWQHVEGPDTPKHKYQIIVSEKEIPEDLVQPDADMRVEEAERSPLLLAVTAPSPARPLYVSVRAVTHDGYYSELSEVNTLTMEDSEVEGMGRASAVWWGCGAAVLAVAALGAALLYSAVRQRRLARNFLRLSAHTPRYDSRRGQATIEHDDDDVPPIQGFSDDEPLVIA